MRGLLYLILALAAVWSGYWFVGASAVERGADAVLDEMRAQGLQVEVADVATRGFPNRFDTTATGIVLADPVSGVAWTAPFFQILALSYKPNHVIAALPDSQSLRIAGQTLDIVSEAMRASVVVEAGTALTLDRTSFVAKTAQVTSTAGWRVALKDARFATRQSGDDFAHDVGIAATDIVLPDAFRASVDPGGLMPDRLDGVRLDATLGLDQPVDRHTLGGGPPPRVERFVLNAATLSWGDIALSATGAVDIGADRLPVGDITFAVTQWREVAQMVAVSGLVAPAYAPTIQALFQSLAEADGKPEVLTAPISFRAGQIWFGFLPLGPAPRI